MAFHGNKMIASNGIMDDNDAAMACAKGNATHKDSGFIGRYYLHLVM